MLLTEDRRLVPGELSVIVLQLTENNTALVSMTKDLTLQLSGPISAEYRRRINYSWTITFEKQQWIQGTEFHNSQKYSFVQRRL